MCSKPAKLHLQYNLLPAVRLVWVPARNCRADQFARLKKSKNSFKLTPSQYSLFRCVLPLDLWIKGEMEKRLVENLRDFFQTRVKRMNYLFIIIELSALSKILFTAIVAVPVGHCHADRWVWKPFWMLIFKDGNV